MTDEAVPFTAEEHARVSAVLAPWAPPKRTRYADDPNGFIVEHAREGCRVWKRGRGCLVTGFIVSPAQRLIDEEV